MAMNFENYLLESNFGKIMNALRGDVPHIDQIGIFTAMNPLGVSLSAQENNKRNAELLGKLREMNYRGYPVNPKWIFGKFTNVEKSFFVPHIDREAAIALAAKYGQRSLIWGHKVDEDGQKFIRFEYIGTRAESEPVPAESYRTEQTRDVVLASHGVENRENNYSAVPFPLSGIDKRSPEKRPVTPRKFVVPFFDDNYEKAKFSADKKSVDFPEHSVVPDISFVLEELPDTPEINFLIESVKHCEKSLGSAGKVPKWYWESRGLLNLYVRKLSEAISKG